MDTEITNCLISLFDSLSAKSDEETLTLFGEALKHAKESNVKLNNPENFECFINYKLKKGVKLLADSMHATPICKGKNSDNDTDKPSFIYLHYSFLENHIQNLCELREGSTCCADKSRHILKMYLKYSIDGEIPEFNPAVENYWTPNFGDTELWIQYCNSLYGLYYGYTKEYFKAYSTLLHCEIRKFKHVLHRWYMEFINGELIEFDSSWDDKDQNPLESYADKGDFYTMHKLKAKVKNIHFELYTPEDGVEKMLYRKSYVKIPKSAIKQIYKKSEERLI